MEKLKIYNHSNYKSCNFYGGGYCVRMRDYLAEGREICPVQYKPSDRRYQECPYVEPQSSIDEENYYYEIFCKLHVGDKISIIPLTFLGWKGEINDENCYILKDNCTINKEFYDHIQGQEGFITDINKDYVKICFTNGEEETVPDFIVHRM